MKQSDAPLSIPNRNARSDDAASITARMSSICASIVAASPVHERSDVPLPRRSKTNTRPIEAKPRTNDTNGGKSQAASMLE
jgi:hypothetical protein